MGQSIAPAFEFPSPAKSNNRFTIPAAEIGNIEKAYKRGLYAPTTVRESVFSAKTLERIRELEMLQRRTHDPLLCAKSLWRDIFGFQAHEFAVMAPWFERRRKEQLRGSRLRRYSVHICDIADHRVRQMEPESDNQCR